jgi:hypothetical protein
MNIWAFLLGLIAGLFPLTLILKFFRGKFLFIANPYVKGATFGFLLWGTINILIFFEVRYNILGLTEMEEGFGTVILLTSSLQGFITSGLAAAFISKQQWKRKAPKS